MDIDLEEDHYDYEKLLNLFSLDPGFNQVDLKRAKRKVLQLHPDKCALDRKYFLFFRKMYFKIEEIYHYSNHAKNEEELQTSIDIQTHFKDYLEQKKINPKTNYKEFSKEFNKMFEKVYVSDQEGHGDWLSSEDNMYHKDDLEKSRKEAMTTSIVTQTNIQEMGDLNKQSLYGYDVKESLGNPFFAMDVNEEYKKKPKFKNVQEYQMYVEKQDITPLGAKQSEDYLNQKEELLNQQAKQLAYQHMKKRETTNQKYNEYITKYLSITQ